MTINKTKLSIALATTLAASSVVAAEQNPFAMASLEKGYMVAAVDMSKEGKMQDGKNGSGKEKAKDAKADADKATMKDSKMQDGKCGEGKCGGAKK